mgnify:FL=1
MKSPLPENTITGGAAIARSAPFSVRGRCSTQTLSWASKAMLDGSPSFHFGGIFGHAGSTSNTGRLRAGAIETRLLRFDATAGNRFFFDYRSLAGDDFRVRLFDPSGNLVRYPDGSYVANATSFTSDRDVFAVTATGTYTLALEGAPSSTNSANWTFNLQPVSDSTEAMTLGSRVNASIDHAGQQRSYTFTLTAESQLLFDSFTSSSTLRWNLTGPQGTLVANRNLSASDANAIGGSTALRLAPGSYTLTVDGSGDATGAYGFRLLDLATAGQKIAYGDAVAATLDPGNQTQVYRFDGTAGDDVLFDWTSMTGGNTYWRLIDPSGRLVFGPDSMTGDRGPFRLTMSGEYRLLVEGQASNTAPVNVAFAVLLQGNTPPAALTGTTIEPGSRVDGSIDVASETDDYVFTIAAPTRVVFDALAPASSNFLWSLTGPRGAEVTDRTFYSSESYEFGSGDPTVELLLPGTYRVRIRASGTTTGAYSFRVFDFAGATPMTAGTPVSGTLNPSNSSALYRLPLTAGQPLYFDMLSLNPNNGGWVSWRMYDPYGRQVVSPSDFYVNADTEGFVPTISGNYTIVVEGRIWDVSSGVAKFDYSFNVLQRPPEVAQPLTLGATNTGHVGQPGQRVVYNFALLEAKRLLMDALQPTGSSPDFRWSLTGPTGTVVSGQQLFYSDSGNRGGSPLLDLVAGGYQLVVDPINDQTGDFAFRLLDLTAAEAIATDRKSTRLNSSHT